MNNHVLASLGLCLVCAACGGGGGDNDGGTDASNNTDSPATNDATTDSNPTNDASGNDASTNDASPALITQCQTQAQHFATLCAGSDPRPCLWNAYAQLCATGQTQLLIDSMNCLDQNTCRTFSDPNNGLACLNTLHSTNESAASKQFIVDACNACSDAGCATSYGTAEIFPYLSDADIAALESSNCRGTACTIDSAVQACASAVPDVNLFLACTK